MRWLVKQWLSRSKLVCPRICFSQLFQPHVSNSCVYKIAKHLKMCLKQMREAPISPRASAKEKHKESIFFSCSLIYHRVGVLSLVFSSSLLHHGVRLLSSVLSLPLSLCHLLSSSSCVSTRERDHAVRNEYRKLNINQINCRLQRLRGYTNKSSGWD